MPDPVPDPAPDVAAPEVIVAGHLCLDILPEFEGEVSLDPGRLASIRRTRYSSGGAVANVGRALLRLGVRAELVGRLGDDAFGTTLREVLADENPAAVAGLREAPGEATSYTVVVSAPGRDRSFLHQPGCNDAFGPDDVDLERAARAKLVYLGYPPLLRSTFSDGGKGLERLFSELRARGVTTVLDTTLPGAESAAGRVDWRAFLARVLPQVDVFVPSLEEALYMLDRERFDAGAWSEAELPAPFVRALGEKLVGMGVAVAGLKLGARGLYLKTASAERLADTLLSRHADWVDRELWTPAFEVEVVGTVGAGDAAMAGLMAALLRGLGPGEALRTAAAVGACCVEAADATSGVLGWEATRARIGAGWSQAVGTVPEGWRGVGEGVYGTATMGIGGPD